MHNLDVTLVKKVFFGILLLVCSCYSYTLPLNADVQTSFQDWLKQHSKRLLKKGFNANFVHYAFKDIFYDTDVIRLDRYQPEFRLSFRDYLERRLTTSRIFNAKYYYQKYLNTLNKIEKQYGIQPEIIVAIWSLETNHGSMTGKRYIVQSLATLAFDGRRRAFFTKELEHALRLMKRNNIKREQFNGSWAGAMGQPQFMPSTYMHYAIDGDADGNVNLWSSLDDVFHSSSNYLKKMRWVKQGRWGTLVKLGPNTDLNKMNLDWRLPVKQWVRMGITNLDGQTLVHPNQRKASIILPMGANGPAFMVFSNFHSILRWNNSSFYALSVGILADLITDRLTLDALNLSNLEREVPSFKQIKDMQAFLNQQGYKAGEPDGIIGPNTTRAIIGYQTNNLLTADGYADFELLEHMQLGSSHN